MNFTKFMGDASAAFNRARQFTEEKIGTAEKTEYDAHFENLITRADQYELAILKILNSAETYLQPNPAYRAEDFVASKLEQFKRSHPLPVVQMGDAFIGVGNALGSNSAYGGSLVQCGQTHQIVGQFEHELQAKAVDCFVKPLRMFIENEIKTLHKERRTMELKRLDLDAYKAKLKKASSEASRRQVESELRVAQSEFNSQVERTKLLLDNISSAQTSHQHCLRELIQAQATYYERCHLEFQKLQRQLSSL